MVAVCCALKPSRLMPDPLSPLMTPPALLVTVVVNETALLAGPPVMPWRAPSIVPVVSFVIWTPVLLYTSTPSLLLPVVVIDLISPAL
jgi:hypothetical protein